MKSPILFLAVLSLAMPSAGLSAAQFAGGGFEGDPPTAGWTTHVYGATPEIAADREVRTEGRQSLRITSAQPTDTALGQEIDLTPGALYRLRGRVKTRDLQGEPGVLVGGTFQIQAPGGAQRLSGKSHFGTSDWQEEALLFRVPSDGKVRIAIFFIGFGKGTGTAWFDDLRLDLVDACGADRFVVKNEKLRSAPISPYQIGQFVEFLCDLVPGMHAERISDDSFEGHVPYRFRYRGEVDFKSRPWYPTGALHRGEYVRDPERPFNGKVSQRIRVTGGEPCTLGISQDGVWVEEGKPLRLRLHLRGEAPGGSRPRAAVRLSGPDRILARADLGPAAAQWGLHEARLIPSAACRDATFTVEFRGPGTLGIDRISLVPEDALPGGWRPDVAAALKDLRPAIIRLGGSSLEAYEWEACVGDPDRRAPFPDPYWGALNANNVGIPEFIALCNAVEAEPLICVRWTGKTPRDAANEVEYLNGSMDTPYGKKRAGHGHPKPYGVKFFQVGNEVSGPEYEKTVADFARAMKAADPSIRLLSAFPSETTVRNAAAVLDFLCPHHYGCAALEAMEADILDLRALAARSGGGRPLRLAVTEWNTTAGDWELGRHALLTLDNALKCARYHNLIQRHADFVEIAIRSNLTNSFCSGILQTRGPDLYLAPTYHAQKLYARAGGDFPLAVETLLPPAADDLDVGATLSPDGKTLRIFAVNDSTAPARRRIDLAGFGERRGEARLFVLEDRDHAGERSVTNEFEDRDRVRTAESVLGPGGSSFEHTFPPLSLSLLEMGI